MKIRVTGKDMRTSLNICELSFMSVCNIQGEKRKGEGSQQFLCDFNILISNHRQQISFSTYKTGHLTLYISAHKEISE